MKATNKNISNNSGFKVPDNYFDNFRDQLNQKLNDKVPVKKRVLKPMHYSIAASIMLILVSTFIFLPFEQNNATQDSKDILISDIEYYDINMNDIYYAYNDELHKEKISEKEISDEALVEYLTDEIEIDDFILYEE